MNAKKINSILWAEEGGIVHCNISPLVLAQLQTEHELNLIMIDIIKLLAPSYKAMMQPLSPHTKPCVCKKDLDTQICKEPTETVVKQNQDNNCNSCTTPNEWMQPKRTIKHKKSLSNSEIMNKAHPNTFEILGMEDDEEDASDTNCNAEEMTVDDVKEVTHQYNKNVVRHAKDCKE